MKRAENRTRIFKATQIHEIAALLSSIKNKDLPQLSVDKIDRMNSEKYEPLASFKCPVCGGLDFKEVEEASQLGHFACLNCEEASTRADLIKSNLDILKVIINKALDNKDSD
jgi:transcription elongation factor Elf1